MTTDYFGAEKTGGGRGHIEITINVKAEKVMDFANEIISATLDKVLEIIDQHIHTTFLPDGSVIDSIEDVEGLRDAIEDLKGGEDSAAAPGNSSGGEAASQAAGEGKE